MKSRLHLFLLPALIAGLNIISAGWVSAQTFTTLHTFAGNDGATPWASLILSGNTLYGTTAGRGNGRGATVFAVNTDGTGFTNLYSFSATSTNSSGAYTNSDGDGPEAGLILSGNTLYGTAAYGGSSGAGTVFAVNTDGTGFTNLHSFDGYPSDGYDPQAGLVLSGNTLYGTAGAVFAINTDGTGFTNLHSFSATSTNSSGTYTNSDGGGPVAGLILSGNTLYGTAAYGGRFGNGTVFAVNTDSTGFTNLHSFSATLDPYYTNSDGAGPVAGLILSGNTLYGTAAYGGSSGVGTVFAVNTDGTGFNTLHHLDGSWGVGGGGYPFAGLILSANTLYGTTSDYWNDFLFGTVFSLSLAPPPPQLRIAQSGANVILSWPTNVAGFDYSGFTLQSTTNLGSPAVWSTVSPGAVVFNGKNTVTNSISGTRQFYRLSN